MLQHHSPVFSALGLAAASLVLIAGPAAAHDTAESTSPASGDTVTTQPGTVSITFNNAPLDVTDAAAIQVVGPDGLYYSDGCVTLAGTTISTAVDLGTPGTYEVTWRSVSEDGHPVSDEFDFEWSPAAGVQQAAGSTTAPVCGESAPASPVPVSESSSAALVTEPASSSAAVEQTTAADSENATASSSSTLTVLVITAVVIVAAVVAWAIWFARRRRAREQS